MKKETTVFEALGRLLFTIAIGVFGSVYKAYILMVIAEWFKFPIALSMVQWFGISEIISLMLFKYNSADKKSETPYFDLFCYYLLISAVWGILFVAHILI